MSFPTLMQKGLSALLKLVALMTDTEPISITALVLKQLHHLNSTSPYLDDELTETK